jgi:hypothetical protein
VNAQCAVSIALGLSRETAYLALKKFLKEF